LFVLNNPKKEDAHRVLQEIYDESKKPNPRGDMMFFIPVWSKLEDDYSPEQRDKFYFLIMSPIWERRTAWPYSVSTTSILLIASPTTN
jgi:hypothetical protein